MTSLHVPLDPLRTKLASVEGKILPRFKSDYLIVSDFELDPTLLSAKTAVRLDQLFRLSPTLPSPGGRIVQMWSELIGYLLEWNWGVRHTL
jgi:hypothetical protein